ncbi:MAG: hypothetical protein M3P48_07485, partial [Actinomycetota bacterium]|nr:hypothetical protein [Actinomycetota bacterium]
CGEYVARAAERLGAGEDGLPGVLALVAQGRVQELGEGFAAPDDAADAVAASLAALVTTALTDRHLAHWRLSWSGPCQLVDESGEVVDVRAFVTEGVRDASGVHVLRAWLERESLIDPLPVPAVVAARPAGDPVQLVAVLPDVVCDGVTSDVVVTDRGLLRLQAARPWLPGVAAYFGATARRRRVAGLLGRPFHELLAAPGSCFTPTTSIRAAVLRRRLGSWVLTLTRTDGEATTMKCSTDGASRAAAEDALRACLSGRIAILDRRGQPVAVDAG